ncbi:inositol 1,4,5-trisphosphate receptor-interacting protein-like 1 [Guaruba guarouba]
MEGWSPSEENIIYRVLVSLIPPYGHAFLPELCNPGEMPERNFRIRVELVCTCKTEQLVGDMLCFIHHEEEEQRRNLGPSLLQTVCTGSYLDVQKTACRFHQLVKACWLVLPHSRRWRLTMLPCDRSCKFKMARAEEEIIIEIMLGVQQGDSDIFMSSQASEALFTPSTTWTLSCAVAEAKFFERMARRAPDGSFHLRCLQLCARILVGTCFSEYTLKTVVMHLLNTTPLSGWHRTRFLLRLDDIMRYLRHCLEEKRLDHFFFGNEKIPEVVLPPALQRAEPFNLFQHLAQDPDAQAQAMREFTDMQDRLTRMLLCNPGEMPERNFRIRVELVCTCKTEQLVGDMLCFIHHEEEEQRRNLGPSLLQTVCTGSYLDVQKTACRFHQLVKACWLVLPHSRRWRLTMLPCDRSCKFKMARAEEEIIIEIMLGVQQGDSDIFMSSQASEALFTPSTTWTLSCAVAEAKFFERMARRAPDGSFHLRCLQLCARILVGTCFSEYTLKTVVMHLLNTTPLSGWHRTRFLLRLDDIMRYLRHCLEEKRLDHFFFGNEKIPEVVLPPALQRAEPFNLFQHLAQDPDAQAQAMREFTDMQDRLTRMLANDN